MQVQNHAYRTSKVVLRLSTRGGTGTHWNGFTSIWTFHTESVVVNARSTLHRPKIRSGLLPRCRFQCFRSCSSWHQVPRPQPGTTGLRQCMCAMVSISAERGQKPGLVNRLFGLQPSSEDSNLLKPATASSEMTCVLASSTWWFTGCSGAQGAGVMRSMQLSTAHHSRGPTSHRTFCVVLFVCTLSGCPSADGPAPWHRTPAAGVSHCHRHPLLLHTKA